MVSQKDKAAIRQALTVAFSDFTSAFDQVNENTINRKPTAESWTPAQVAEHIILATAGVPDGHLTPLSSRRQDGTYDSLLSKIRPWWEDLNQKFESPEVLRPGNQPGDKKALLSAIGENLKRDLLIIDNLDLTEICLDFELPGVGYLTRYEWLWFIEMHLRRHTYQLKNMKNLL